jgi:hypothetical protein
LGGVGVAYVAHGESGVGGVVSMMVGCVCGRQIWNGLVKKTYNDRSKNMRTPPNRNKPPIHPTRMISIAHTS